MSAMSWTISDLIEQLEPDPWRTGNPFSNDMVKCHEQLFDNGKSRHEKALALSDWLAQYQPCLFGRMEARQRRLPICVLTENDWERGDQEIRSRIARERTAWKRQAFGGNTHGFLIAIVSERVAVARPGGPNSPLHRLASRLCELYLGNGNSDEIIHDDVMLEIASNTNCGGEIRKWKVGVNFFSAQGDGRWWKDHRIPGGVAFSMNSVGHMARTRAEQSLARNPKLIEEFSDVPRERLVYFALLTAMKTIGPPGDGSSTRGTWLAAHGSFEEDKEPPPFDQRTRHFGELAEFSENRYRGYYHTDHSIPSDYFVEGLWRQEDLKVRDDLYFTYLHSKADTDYLSMGLGEVINLDGGADATVSRAPRSET